jgi:hypothetical protein
MFETWPFRYQLQANSTLIQQVNSNLRPISETLYAALGQHEHLVAQFTQYITLREASINIFNWPGRHPLNPQNPNYVRDLRQKIDTFLAQHPAVTPTIQIR